MKYFTLRFLMMFLVSPLFGAESLGHDVRSIVDFYHHLPPHLRTITTMAGDEIRSVTGDLSFIKEIEIEPRDEYEVYQIVEHMMDHPERKLVVGAGNWKSGKGGWQGLSIGGHAQGMKGDVYLSTRRLKTHMLKDTEYRYDVKNESITLTVKAGNSWEETMDLALKTLPEHEQDDYLFVPYSAPTSEKISIAGSLTSHGHSRTSAFGGGYMPESVVSFSLITVQHGRVTKLLVSRQSYPELFFALPGSFGRGGIITDITLKLQRIPKQSRVLTTITQYQDSASLIQQFNEKITAMKNDEARAAPRQRPFFTSFVSVTSTGSFYLYESRLVTKKEAKKYPYFNFFEKPGITTGIIQSMAHHKTKVANAIVDMVLTGNGQSKTYQNHPVSWIFAQDSYLKYVQYYDDNHNDHMMLAHQAYVLPASALKPVLTIAKSLQKNYEQEYGLACKMEDIVPLNASPFIMAPAYGAKEDLFIYTFTWPIKSQAQKTGVLRFRADFLTLCNESEEIGSNKVRSHPLKEFEKDSLLIYRTYKEQVLSVEDVLADQGIDDSFMWNNVFGTLFQIGRGVDN